MTRIFNWLFLLSCLYVNSGSTLAQNATDIIRRSIELSQGNSSKAEMLMQIIRPSWAREIGIKSWSLGTEYGLILITEPARDKGTAFLKRGNELWNWQPRIERSIKMPPSMMLQSWMGSDFTNDDLVRQSSIVDDYSHKLLKEEVIEGRFCYVIELIPKPNAPVVWGKVISWISKDGFLTLKTEFYDEDGELANTMLGKNIRKMDDRELPTLIEVIPEDEDGNKTVITYKFLDFDIAVDASFFSVQNMRTAQ
jgi:outer membrane lipoprotein-sorting protein